MTPEAMLPVPVTDMPHWRVAIRPTVYEPERIPRLGQLRALVEQGRVRLRGWDYPHMGRGEEWGQGNSWIASWTSFMGHVEYWRFYQSGQFLHLSAVREAVEEAWDHSLRRAASYFAADEEVGVVPGFFDVTNFLYRVTEIFEFAARLAQTEHFSDGRLVVDIRLSGIEGFGLSTSPDRELFGLYRATAEILGRSWEVEPDQLMAGSSQLSLNAVVWFFERFGWLEPPIETLRADQERFLAGLL